MTHDDSDSRHPPEYHFPPPTPSQITNTKKIMQQYRPPPRYNILADYGDGYIIVAHHPTPDSAAAQAEHRFINTAARSVIVRRHDRPDIPIQDGSGKHLEWTRT